MIFGPWANTEFYAQGGFSFHSNDGRGTTQTVEPVSADNPYPNTPVAKIPPLVQTKGGEIGVRTVAVPHLQSTLSLWYLHSNSELQQDGDTGGTVCFRTVEQPLWHRMGELLHAKRNIWLLILTLRTPELNLPKQTQMMRRRAS